MPPRRENPDAAPRPAPGRPGEAPLALSLVDEAEPEPCPPSFNMADYVMQAGRRTPGKTALTVLTGEAETAETWTYAALDRAIHATAAGLIAAGLEPGDRVALRLGNVSDFPILFFGTIAAGGIAAPTSAQLTEPEFLRLARDLAPRFIAVSEGLELAAPPATARILTGADLGSLRRADPCPARLTDPDAPAYIVYTSGTSSQPKGVLHAHRAAWARRMMWQGWYGLTPDDVMLHAGAFNWTYTLGTGLTDPWAAGAASLIHQSPPDAALWPRIAAHHHPTLFAAVPGVYRQMLRSPQDLAQSFATLRHGLTAGEQMATALARDWQAQSGKPVYEALGMSEISTFVSASPATPPRPGTAGRPQPGRRIAILDGPSPAPIGQDGDLAVSRRDPGLMLGYLNRPEETATAFRGEWFVTGDRARMDSQGYITHLGRADDVMTALGYRVSPQEVEETLAQHPAVAEVAVTETRPRPDLALITAFVVPKADWPGEDSLAAFAAARLAAYKCPRIWHRAEHLPRTANGKLQRQRLAETIRTDP